MLITALQEQFVQSFAGQPACQAILWFDSEQDYHPILEKFNISGLRLRIIASANDLIRLRSDLQFLPPGEKLIIYLPFSRDDPAVDILTPILPLAAVFNDSLLRFLSQHDVEFPEDPKTRSAIKDVLPRLALQSLGKGPGYWKKVLASLDAVREELLGDFEETLLRFLALPQETLGELRQRQVENFFLALLGSRYGLEASDHQAAAEEPAALARRLAAHLLLVQAYESAGRPASFPFQALLPPAHLLETCQSFLRRWQDSSYRSAFEKLAGQIEPHYALDAWAAALPLEQALRLSAFAGLESLLWERVQAQFKTLDDAPNPEAAWLAFLNEHAATILQRAQGYWARQGKAPQWALLRQAAGILLNVKAWEAQIDHCATLEDLAQRYAAPDGWQCLDRAYREFRQALGEAPTSYDRLSRRAGRAYHRFLRRTNERLAELLTARLQWDWRSPNPQAGLWDAAIQVKKGKRTAVIFVDALRLELGYTLLDRLRRDLDEGDLHLDVCLGTIPGVTKIGMPACLPGAGKMQVNYTTDWQVTIGESGNLAIKAGREAYLRERFPRIQVYSQLSDLLDTPLDRIPASAELYITFHTALDNLGEEAQELALPVFSELLKQVERAIRKLREAEVDEIHVVTDHGFLFLDDIAEEDKAPVKDVPALKKASRYLVGSGMGFTDQLRFPVPGSANLEAWFPRGIGCFKTPGKYNYTHGGLSLQELILPHLTIQRQAVAGLISVKMEAPDALRQKLEKVKLRPASQTVFDRARQVELRLVKASAPSQPLIALPQVIEPSEEVVVKVLLPDDAPLEIGEKVLWQVLDSVSGQVLAEQAAVNKVDFF